MSELWAEICRRAPDFRDVSDMQDLFTEPARPLLFRNKVLMVRRNYFIRMVKDPIRKALETMESVSWLNKLLLLWEVIKAVRRYPQVKREDAEKQNTFAILDIADVFLKYERLRDTERDGVCRETPRAGMFRTILKIIAGENEHDNYYGSRMCFCLEEAIKAVLDGRWASRPIDFPDPEHWLEPRPYGGENSIISKIQAKREEINKLLEG